MPPFHDARFLLLSCAHGAEGVPLNRSKWRAGAAIPTVLCGIMAVNLPAVAAPAQTGASNAPPAAHASGTGHAPHGGPGVKSNVALVIDEAQGETLYAKHEDQVAPIASITKLMTAMAVLDAQLPLDEMIEIDKEDVDRKKHTHSRLPVGASLTRGELLRIALMSSENRAAAALAR